MSWIEIKDESEIPYDRDVIVKDCNGRVGLAFKSEGKWYLETFGELARDITFDRLIAYFSIP